jgi:hypothetical protein
MHFEVERSRFRTNLACQWAARYFHDVKDVDCQTCFSFLDDIDRVTRDDYIPTSGEPGVLMFTGSALTADTADILRARVTTIGPEEHRIKVESGTHLSSLGADA